MSPPQRDRPLNDAERDRMDAMLSRFHSKVPRTCSFYPSICFSASCFSTYRKERTRAEPIDVRGALQSDQCQPVSAAVYSHPEELFSAHCPLPRYCVHNIGANFSNLPTSHSFDSCDSDSLPSRRGKGFNG